MARNDITEIRVKDTNKGWEEDKYDTIYTALELTPFNYELDGKEVEEKRWVINPEEPYNSFTVEQDQLDAYIELFTKLKAQTK